ncbi:DUF551 domain-containing protein [Yersinia kristensenii]|uniref:DUF551 domain-containing protein n=1 Tax=Yersinia kristensenii TaxID=28152 RepID=UPI0005DDCE0E|nr:DUF551 domain-containing protein [Yersinia kristensenii]CFR20056.1 Protein of uncharacterised function (DUF551) [Yersinia kristensenii]
MKELDSFTVEEIEEIISSCQQEIHNTPTGDEMPVSPRELLSLARIALAAKRAEPIDFIYTGGGDCYGWSFVDKNENEIEIKDDQKLYLFPPISQLNSPEIPDCWIKFSDRMPDKEGHYTGWGTYYDGDEPCYIPFYYHCDNKKYKRDRLEPIEDDCDPDKVTITYWAQLPDSPERPL